MTGLNFYLISYDIRDESRWRSVHNIMKEFGTRLHYSVFRCDLNRQGRIELIALLSERIKHDEDRIMIVNLGPLKDNAMDRITFIGERPPEDLGRQIIV